MFLHSSFRDGLSLSLGVISVISWGVAEIPQIMTNYSEKSTEGLSIAFLTTWMIGDIFNLLGCLMEPATLPTQFYMALLYTVTTSVLYVQSIYYGHIYPRLKNRRNQMVEAERISIISSDVKIPGRWRNSSDATPCGGQTTPITMIPGSHRTSFTGRELFYTSARSLSSSHTPPAGSVLAQRMARGHSEPTLEEPLLPGDATPPSLPPSTKSLLCVVSVFLFLGTFNLPNMLSESRTMAFGEGDRVFVVRAARKLLQVTSSNVAEHSGGESSRIGMFLGWAMAAIYMGGRLPQICLNMRRGHVEGLNPLMFFFALVGNMTYVASILVNSVEWLKIAPNLPWLVDAGGCVVLDFLILLQFFHFRCRKDKDTDKKKHETAETV
ncbi:PQ-loop repeat [Arabidopsis thaliana x Arabidopsis arenosa]|uniref:PQ-loop repeat n=2 Tax=Arabidopsis TaxID=3701 RepID=A0A8T1XCJ2_ARASU|nr:PQ-loop repeat [Arabidopsis suecica]KAG7569995.1 PQ-loop repeat [Arabidopsis thaliana x Arabidopsis arenosa]KAG7574453.1 PQ-loop repeat [Arabidopsis suecica]